MRSLLWIPDQRLQICMLIKYNHDHFRVYHVENNVDLEALISLSHPKYITSKPLLTNTRRHSHPAYPLACA